MIAEFQEALRSEELDGWLFADQRRRDPLAYRLLRLQGDAMATRRWFYFVPVEGEPCKLVHKVESSILDSLPGKKSTYSAWPDQLKNLSSFLGPGLRVAMQYSPQAKISAVSLVDAGLVELIRSLGPIIVSSANLIQQFEARWTAEQIESHVQAGKLVDRIRANAFALIRSSIAQGEPIDEYKVQQFIRAQFIAHGLVSDHGPIVAVNRNASDPHFEPSQQDPGPIRMGDLVLIDLWAKLARPEAVYYDITWTGFCGRQVPDRIQEVFDVVRDARKNACRFVINNIGRGSRLEGWQVDDEARNTIVRRGYGDFILHRTGHSIGTEVHGAGANMDNFETHDERPIIPQTAFSVEPGIYLPEFGIRSEVNMLIEAGGARVTGEEQENLVLLA